MKRDIDTLIIGKNHLALALGIELIKKNKSVVVVDDDRFMLGKSYFGSLLLFEKKYLTVWGQKSQITSFCNVDQFLRPRPLSFAIDDIRIYLGDTPKRNFLELLRKLPFLLEYKFSTNLEFEEFVLSLSSDNSFDEEFFSYCEEFADIFLSMSKNVMPRFEVMYKNAPEKVKILYQAILDFLHKGVGNEDYKYWQIKNLLYLGRGYYQDVLSFNISDVGLLHYILCILSPHYELEQESICRALEEEFVKSGGAIKKARVDDIYSNIKGVICAANLSSLEGLIKCREVILFSALLPYDFKLQLDSLKSYYTPLNVSFYPTRKEDISFDNIRIVHSSIRKMGTGKPLWLLDYDGKKMHCDFFVETIAGTKLDFIKEEILQELRDEYRKYFSGIEDELLDITITKGLEVWTCDTKTYKQADKDIIANFDHLDTKLNSQSVKLYFHRDTEKKEYIKNCTYFGPLENGNLGPFYSYLRVRHEFLL